MIPKKVTNNRGHNRTHKESAEADRCLMLYTPFLRATVKSNELDEVRKICLAENDLNEQFSALPVPDGSSIYHHNPGDGET